MPEVSPLASSTPPSTASQRLNEAMPGMTPDAFLKLLVNQLKYQDPMKPMDSNQLMEQTATLQQVEMLGQLYDGQQDMIAINQLSVASSMLGGHVRYVDQFGREAEGLVAEVRTNPKGASLVIDGVAVPLTNVLSVSVPTTAGPSPAQPPAPAPAGTTPGPAPEPTSPGGSETPDPTPATAV